MLPCFNKARSSVASSPRALDHAFWRKAQCALWYKLIPGPFHALIYPRMELFESSEIQKLPYLAITRLGVGAETKACET
jgi:hypothetical protein